LLLPSRAAAYGSAALPKLLAVLALGCSGGEAKARSEAAAVSHAVEALRNADNGRKSALLAALRSVPCSVADVCGVQSFCVAAYEQHVNALELILHAKQVASSAPVEALRGAVAAAQNALVGAKELTDACATKQGELARHYHVAR
jgi:hypothetical protein